MNDLYPMLLRWSGHPRPLIRKISLWSMSRYTNWVLYTARKREELKNSSNNNSTTQNISNNFLELTIQCYCQRMVDHTKIVQAASCSSLGILAEQAKTDGSGNLLLPLAQPMLQTCVQCLNSYQEKNLILVCDTLAFVIECCKSRHDIVRSPQFLQMVMPPLIARWNLLKNAEDHQYVRLSPFF
jgi:transportin-1